MSINDASIVQTVIAIYSSNFKMLGNFYKEALDLIEIESGKDYLCLGNNGIEINILRMNSKEGKAINAEKSLHIRAETPIKCSFIVTSFEQVRNAIIKYGGMIKDEENAWEWRGALHLDGYDPEGNVLQFRIVK